MAGESGPKRQHIVTDDQEKWGPVGNPYSDRSEEMYPDEFYTYV